jgi:hypothetical protein
MTSQSPRIYIYKITFEEVPYYYYGVHKEKRFDEEYWGSPYTHKWCWEFYTPKKQILQLFEFSDEGWLEANLIEDRLIKPVFNKDKWCLNEGCGGKISLKVSRDTGRKCGISSMENGTGLFGRSKEKRVEDAKKASLKAKELGVGIYGLTQEELIENGKKYYEKTGLAKLTKQERSEIAKKVNTQRWMCLETGYISTPGALGRYQKARGIDTTKRVRIS